ncbi:MAG: glycosyltransferase family 2 protein [Candidatus Angelobacter sp.]
MTFSDSPKVSVIVSFLDAQAFFREAVESVLAQTFADWELLLVDDGSSDQSSSLALQYAAQHSERIRYFQHDGHANRGLPASRNLGLRQARGKYIALLDSDDVWLSRKLEEQVGLLEMHPGVVLLYGSSQYWYSWTGKQEDIALDFVQGPDVPVDKVYDPPILLRLFLSGTVSTPCPSDILFRRDPILRLGGFEESFGPPFTMHEDQAFLAKVLLHGSVFVAKNCWDRYRIHANSCCAVTRREGRESAVELAYLAWLEQYLRRQGVSDAAIWSNLRRTRFRRHHPMLARIFDRGRGLITRRMLRKDSGPKEPAVPNTQ